MPDVYKFYTKSFLGAKEYSAALAKNGDIVARFNIDELNNDDLRELSKRFDVDYEVLFDAYKNRSNREMITVHIK
mgnify:CR=1 FL=1